MPFSLKLKMTLEIVIKIFWICFVYEKGSDLQVIGKVGLLHPFVHALHLYGKILHVFHMIQA